MAGLLPPKNNLIIFKKKVGSIFIEPTFLEVDKNKIQL